MNRVTPAAGVLLYRICPSPEFLLVRRNPQLRFLPGFWAFPGGKYQSSDDEIHPISGVNVANHPDFELLVTGVRELFEETGILLARNRRNNFPEPEDSWFQIRQQLHQNDSFADFLNEQELHIHTDDFQYVGELTTPEFTNLRFRTRFFLAKQPSEQEAHLLPGELDELCWSTPTDMLDSWSEGQILLSPPTLEFLLAGKSKPVDEIADSIRERTRPIDEGAIPPIYFAPQVQMIPLRTHGLPPSTHTNAYLFGNEPAYLFDPGTEDPVEQQRLFDLLDDRIRRGMKLKAIVLTHHHQDHIGAVNACAERYGIPVWAHPITAELLSGNITCSAFLNEGDVLPLGQSPQGNGSWQLHVLHTPGHASGHLAFWEPVYRLLFVADLVSALSSVVIAPPDGNLQVYLDSLKRMQSFPTRLLLPCHGSPSSRPEKTLEECIQHRIKREQQLLETLSTIPQTIDELLPILYKGTPSAVLFLAGKQLEAGLLKLAEEGKAEICEQGWRRTE